MDEPDAAVGNRRRADENGRFGKFLHYRLEHFFGGNRLNNFDHFGRLKRRHAADSRNARAAFRSRFWCQETEYPYDCVSEGRDIAEAWSDRSVRPNALIALAKGGHTLTANVTRGNRGWGINAGLLNTDGGRNVAIGAVYSTLERLHDKGYLVQKPHYVPYCPVAGPVAVDKSETDIKQGGSAEILEFLALKFQLPAGTVFDEPVVLPCATLRPCSTSWPDTSPAPRSRWSATRPGTRRPTSDPPTSIASRCRRVTTTRRSPRGSSPARSISCCPPTAADPTGRGDAGQSPSGRRGGENRLRGRGSARGGRCHRWFVGHRFDRQHFIDVGAEQLEDALQPRVGRDRLDAERHAITR